MTTQQKTGRRKRSRSPAARAILAALLATLALALVAHPAAADTSATEHRQQLRAATTTNGAISWGDITGAIKWGDANFAFAQLRRLRAHTPWPPP
jgi:hypothetical protein